MQQCLESLDGHVEYRNHHLDSTRWDGFAARDDDIFVTTAYKAGTTWMQRILAALVLGPGPLPATLREVSPWIDARFMGPIEPILAGVEAQRHRRFIKSHLAADGLRFFPEAKYIVVGRDTRDVFMSFFNHYSGYTDLMYALFNDADRPGPELPRCPADHARAVAAVDQRRLVRVGARRLAVLVASPSPGDVVGSPRPSQHPVRALRRPEGRSRRRDPAHRCVLRYQHR